MFLPPFAVYYLAMFSFKLGIYLLVSAFAMHLLPSAVLCKVISQAHDKPDLLHDINIYRRVLNLPVLEELDKMSCLAEMVADDLDNSNHCQDFGDYYPAPGADTKIPNFQNNLKRCKIDINTTKDGVIMPVCVHKLDQDALFSNYTKSNRFAKYLNNSNYTVAGAGSEDDWMVLIVSTNNTSSGDFSSATSLLAGADNYLKGHWLVLVLFSKALINVLI